MVGVPLLRIAPHLMSTPGAPGGAAVAQKPSRRRGWWLRWVLTVGLLALVGTQVNLGEVVGTFRSLLWGYVLLALALVAAERVVATLRWWLLLRVKEIDISFGSLLVLHLTAGFAGSFLPTSFGVDAVRIAMLTSRVGKQADCIAASIVDRVVMVAGTMALAAVMTALYSSRLPLDDMVRLVPFAAVLCLGTMGVLLRAEFIRGFLRMSQRFLGAGLTKRLGDAYWAVHAYHRHSGALMVSALLTGAIQLLRILFILALGLAVGASASFLEYLLVMPLGAVIMMLPVSIGGFGLQEGVYATLMGMIGVSVNDAVTMSLLDHVSARSVALVGAILWILRPGDRAVLDAQRAS